MKKHQFVENRIVSFLKMVGIVALALAMTALIVMLSLAPMLECMEDHSYLYCQRLLNR